MYLERHSLDVPSSSSRMYRGARIALLIPCFNEEISIVKVIRDFRAALPSIDIHVFDNDSNDQTASLALSENAAVTKVNLRGKGNVVRRMFADVDADIYVMVDGDGTYEANAVRRLVDRLIDEQADMVVACRESNDDELHQNYRRGHQWGNRLLTTGVGQIFGGAFRDMLSGYRVFSRRYVKSFPAASTGFEIETELTVHALELRMPWCEEPTRYGARPAGSKSKLSTYRDGWKIIWTIAWLYINERPLAFFSICALAMLTLSFGLALPVFIEYFEIGLVPRLPTAILSAFCMMMAMLAQLAGLILNTVTRGRQEAKRFWYLSVGRLTSALH